MSYTHAVLYRTLRAQVGLADYMFICGNLCNILHKFHRKLLIIKLIICSHVWRKILTYHVHYQIIAANSHALKYNIKPR